MFLSLDIYKINLNELKLSKAKKNLYHENSIFYKIFYKNQTYIIDNLIMNMRLIYLKKNNENNKIKILLDNDNNENISILNKLQNIETYLFKKIIKDTNIKIKYIYEIIIKNNFIYINQKKKDICFDFNNENIINIKLIINGIWKDNNNNYGFSYKFI